MPLLAKACQDNGIYTRVPAALALARIQPQHPRVIAVFMQTLVKRCGLSYYFSSALIDLGPNARLAVPWLVEALKHEDHAAYLAALRALQRVDPQATDKVWSARGLLQLRDSRAAATLMRKPGGRMRGREKSQTFLCR